MIFCDPEEKSHRSGRIYIGTVQCCPNTGQPGPAQENPYLALNFYYFLINSTETSLLLYIYLFYYYLFYKI